MEVGKFVSWKVCKLEGLYVGKSGSPEKAATLIPIAIGMSKGRLVRKSESREVRKPETEIRPCAGLPASASPLLKQLLKEIPSNVSGTGRCVDGSLNE